GTQAECHRKAQQQEANEAVGRLKEQQSRLQRDNEGLTLRVRALQMELQRASETLSTWEQAGSESLTMAAHSNALKHENALLHAELRRLRPLLERRLFREVEPEELTSSLRVTSVLLELFGQGPLPELLAPLEATRGLPLLWAGEGAAGYHSDQVDILYYEEGTWILGFWSFSDLPPRGQAPPPVRLQREQTEKALGQPVQLESWSVLTGEVHRFP
ncbi:MAG TPA: hypothetical protein PKW90_26690, partial [Myxococcota bacterium]|nr:hypothetical protein [Myxococcota bacterium]